MVSFFDLDSAFNFVSAAGFGENSAFICKGTGKIFYISEFGDSDDDLPDDINDSDRYIQMPNKQDLDLGHDLVREFVRIYMPEKSQEVENIFRKKSAYSRFKGYLDSCNLLEKWYDFEELRTESELKKWCLENNIEIDEEKTSSS